MKKKDRRNELCTYLRNFHILSYRNVVPIDKYLCSPYSSRQIDSGRADLSSNNDLPTPASTSHHRHGHQRHNQSPSRSGAIRRADVDRNVGPSDCADNLDGTIGRFDPRGNERRHDKIESLDQDRHAKEDVSPPTS